jgi:hypothetical protein
MKNKSFILGAGAQKSGTTWLFHYIRNNTKSNMGFMKEYHIWDALYSGGFQEFKVTKEQNNKSKIDHYRYIMQHDKKHYFGYFNSLFTNDNITVTGDITPSYSTLDGEIFSEIKAGFNKLNIDCRVIFLMRDPLNRIISAARSQKHTIGKNFNNESDFLISYYQTIHCMSRSQYDITVNEIERAFSRAGRYYGIYESMFEKKIF